jgi:hypothetical protein
MRRVLVGCVVAWAGLVSGGKCAGGEADDLLARARKAQTGSTDTDRADAVVQFQVTLSLDGHKVRFDGECVARAGECDRLTLTVQYDGSAVKFTALGTRDGVRHCTKAGGGNVPWYSLHLESGRFLDSLRDAARAPLLHGSADSQLLFSEKIGGRAAVGFNFRPPREEPAWRYYFDRETGVLLKAALRREGRQGFREEFVYTGHSETTAGAADGRTLESAGIEADPVAVADFLRKQTADPARAERIKALMVKLGHDDFVVREQATKDLVALGRPALPPLERATKSNDPEVARRAEIAVDLIRARLTNETMSAAVRVLTRGQPAGTTAVLLDLLPAADPEVAGEIRAALAALARRGGKTDAALEKAVRDPDEVKRRAAETALGTDGGKYLNQPGRRLYPGPCKFPAKVVISVSGNPTAEVEFVGVQFFNRLDDRVFAKP